MEEQLQQYLTEFIKTLKQGGQFAMEQLPLFVQEYLTWGLWKSSILAILFLIISIVSVKISLHLYRKGKNYESSSMFDEGDFPYYLGSAVSFISFLGCGMGFIVNSITLLKIIIAPRIYLVENLLKLVN